MASHQPLIDPFQIERITKEAGVQRMEYLRDKAATGADAARWSGLATLAASCLALFVSHGAGGPQSTAGGQSGKTITHTK